MVLCLSLIALPKLLPKYIGNAPSKQALLNSWHPMANQEALLGWVRQKVSQLQAGNVFGLWLQFDFPASQSCLIKLGAVMQLAAIVDRLVGCFQLLVFDLPTRLSHDVPPPATQ